MERLQISRGNVNMNVRTLMDWGMIYKENKIGERREYFIGEKDMWLILRRVMKVRKEKELDPVLRILAELKNIDEKPESPEIMEFNERLKSIEKFALEADSTLEKLIKVDENWFWSNFARMMR
jgi:DNA-binding transcriptional regulator GbsR (MarR family)